MRILHVVYPVALLLNTHFHPAQSPVTSLSGRITWYSHCEIESPQLPAAIMMTMSVLLYANSSMWLSKLEYEVRTAPQLLVLTRAPILYGGVSIWI